MWNSGTQGSPGDPETNAREAVDRGQRATHSEEHADLERYFTRHDRWAWRHRFWLAGGAVLLVAVVVIVIGALVSDERTPRSAEELLALAAKPLSDPAAPITTLHAEQTYRQYFLGPGLEGRFATEITRRVWYEAPNRQRTEVEASLYNLDGSVARRYRETYLWDGNSAWRYDGEANRVDVDSQNPSADPWRADMGVGPMLGRRAPDPQQQQQPPCGHPTAVRPGRVLDRLTQVFESMPLGCGYAFPGTDGAVTTWVDDRTGLQLRSEHRDGRGAVGLAIETTALEVNRDIDPTKFVFVPPDGTALQDNRPNIIGEASRTPDLRFPSIAEAQAAASFPLKTELAIPANYTLAGATVTNFGPGISGFSNALFIYAGPPGQWLVVAQGPTPYSYTEIGAAAGAIPHGTTTVGGVEAHWVNGRQIAGEVWEPGTMTSVAWEDPTGNGVTHQQFAVASNALGVDDLRAIAESLR